MWRLKWLLRELFRSDASAALVAPALYKWAMLLKYPRGVHRAPIRFRMKDGHTFDVRDFMTLFIFREIFVDCCYDVALPSEPVVIDVGANTGMFALRAVQLWPGCRLYCYEPHPDNFQALNGTIADNRMQPMVQAFQEGVGGRSRNADLHLHPKNIGGHSILESKKTGHHVPIKIVDVAELLARTPQGRCDLLKLDCEGAEHEIIMSIDKRLATRIPRIIYEYSAGATGAQARRHLADLGYEVGRKSKLFLAVQRRL
jgi:FkbM family methyltransferase